MFSRFIIISMSFATVLCLQNKYCQLSCDYYVNALRHTVCERQNEECGAAEKCGPDFKMVQFTDADRQYMVDIHNFLRNKVALGNETRGIQPPSSNMRTLRYNKELENIAQCWANTCNGRPLIHDKCRRTSEFEHVGQNLGYINSSFPQIDKVRAIKELTLLWYNEVALFKNEWVKDTQDRGPILKIGHYTQMLWADTTDVGCAAAFYSVNAKNKKWYNMVFVCNYGPGGNYIGLPMYDEGKPCSKCPEDHKQNQKYKGLCGATEKVGPSIKEEKDKMFEMWYNKL